MSESLNEPSASRHSLPFELIVAGHRALFILLSGFYLLEMFSKAIFVAFLSVALSAYAAPANQHNQKPEVCPVSYFRASIPCCALTRSAHQSVSTVTVTALPSATTGVTLVNNGNGNGRGGNNAGNGGAAAGKLNFIWQSSFAHKRC